MNKETSKQRKCCSQAREQTLCHICRCQCQTCKWAGTRSSFPQNLPVSASLLHIGSAVVKKTANKCIAYRQLQWKVQPVNITYRQLQWTVQPVNILLTTAVESTASKYHLLTTAVDSTASKHLRDNCSGQYSQ